MTMEIRNPRRTASGGIACMLVHPEFGEIPYAAMPDSGEEQMEEIWQALQARDDVAPLDPVAPPPPPTLTPRQFVWMLAYTRLEEIWDAVEQQAKAMGNRALYAALRAQRSSGEFILATTLAFVSDPIVQAIVQEIAPDADLSETAITDAWMMAAAQRFETLSAPPQIPHAVTDDGETVTVDGEAVTDTPA